MDDLLTLPRRYRSIRVPTEPIITLFQGGVFEFSPALPRDAVSAGYWVLPDTHELLIAIHSREFGLVRVGDILPHVAPPRMRRVG